MGTFPAHGTRSREQFQGWLDEMQDGIKRLEDSGKRPAPWAVNLVVHATNPRYPGDLELVERYKVPVVLTSKGAPGDAIRRIHGWGAVALHDIANHRHAEKALEAGVDGVIAVAGGAGGHTGTINPFALMNEVRQLGDHFAIVLAGSLTTGRDVLAAQAMGADMGYIGTRFIATREAMAADAHKEMILNTRATDVFFTASIDGAPANWLAPSLTAAGIDLDVLRTTLPSKIVSSQENKKRWKDIYTAGHGVGNIADVPTAAELCRRLIAQYNEAKRALPPSRNVTVAA
jgi:nitronate monooxygenase